MRADNFAIAFIIVMLIFLGVKKVTEDMARREDERMEQIIERCRSK
jgi:hypothetical protein